MKNQFNLSLARNKMAANKALAQLGRQRNKTNERKTLEIIDEELRRRHRFSKANILFILRIIKEAICLSTQRSNPVTGTPSQSPKHSVLPQMFEVQCKMSSFFCQNCSRSTK